MTWGRGICAAGAIVGSLLLAACGGGGSSAATTEATTAVPSACKKPPVTMDLESLDRSQPAGGPNFEVTDGVARRVAILPGEMAFDPSALSGLESKAGVTPLAAYVLYLADFAVPRSTLTGVGAATITPAKDKTIATLRLVPANEQGFIAGAVVEDGDLGYETRSDLTPLSLTVLSGANKPVTTSDVTGQVKILELSDTAICVDIDVTMANGSDPVYRAKGTVQVPVVRAADAYFLT